MVDGVIGNKKNLKNFIDFMLSFSPLLTFFFFFSSQGERDGKACLSKDFRKPLEKYLRNSV